MNNRGSKKMAKSVGDRVQNSFSGDNREDIFKYMDWIHSSILDYNQVMRKMALFVILLIASFEIVVGSRNESITIGSFRLAQGSVVLVLLPGLVAFLVIQMMADAGRVDQLITVYQEVFKLWSEKAEANDLDTEALTFPPLYWNPTSAGYREVNKSGLYKLTDNSGSAFSFIILIGILAFEAHAYYILLPAHTHGFILWAISLSFTVCCLILAAFIFTSLLRS
jgi:hypothetical protein